MRSMKSNSVTVIGSLNYDIIFKQSRLPIVGETFTADSVTFCGGGKGANQAIQCSKLGLQTYMVGKIGDDFYGSVLLESLRNFNVDVANVTACNTNTGLGVVNSIHDGSLVATISTGANYELTIEDINRAEDIISQSSVVILQLEIPKEVVEYSIKLAKQHNCYVILNAAPAKEISKEAMKLVDCLVVNESEASFYAGENVSNVEDAKNVAKKLHEMIGDLLIITLGGKGSLIYDGSEYLVIPPQKVEVVETTGAGDSYIGAFAYGIIKGMSYSEAGTFSSKVSSLTITKIGAQAAMPTLSEVVSDEW